jgi:16S rRNA (adenine1518-N6/adenine1519-N6)-dimethyltransferase
MLSCPTQLRAFLRALGVTPNKALSQNFLIDGNIVRKILAEGAVKPGDSVLEIGPGPGALTEALSAQGAQIFAVEKDPIYANALKRLPEVHVFAEDIRQFDFSILPSKCKAISNLPYHLTAPILGLLVPQYKLFTTITVMVQEEVARRMTASPKTEDYGSLALFLNFYSTVRYAFKVSRRCFYPQPKVDSAVVTLTLKEPPAVDADRFFQLVHTAFGQRRKMVKSTLGPAIGELLEHMNENPQSRPEELSLETFLAIYRYINNI